MELVLGSIALVSACGFFWCWHKRAEAERRAAEARREAQSVAELADAGRAARDLAHDLGNLIGILHLNVQQLDPSGRPVAPDLVEDIHSASLAIYRVFEQWRGRDAQLEPPTTDGLLRSLAGLLGRTGVDVELRIDAPLGYRGESADLVRVLQSLVLEASRQAVRARDPRLTVEMTADELRIEGPAPEREGESSSAEEIDRERNRIRGAAERIGWRIDRALEEERAIVRVRFA